MVQYYRDLIPGTVYITITLPEPLPYATTLGTEATPFGLHNFDAKSYKIDDSSRNAREEFEWGLYIHHGPGHSVTGSWYRLARDMSDPHDTSRRVFMRQDMMQSPRLFSRVIGLISVLQLPRAAGPAGKASARLAEYLDTLAPETISPTLRSHI